MNGLGLLATALIAFAAIQLGTAFPIIGSSVFAIVIGMIVRNTVGLPESFSPGMRFSAKKALQYSIVFLGFTLSFQQVSATGLDSLSITLVTITLAFLTAYVVGRLLGLSSHLRTLIGFGTAICGGSAIAAASPIIEADDDEIALSISTIFLFNIIAVFLFPFLGHAMGMSDFDFGLWAGTAINDTSSVVAAGYTYSPAAGDIATIVKLSRALMIVPACFIMMLYRFYSSRKSAKKVAFWSIIPWFIIYFMLASLVSSLGLVPTNLLPLAKSASQWLMAMALAGIGYQVSFKQFLSAGLKPIATGAITWAVVAISSLILQGLLF
ncbi:YeiH family protein [Granulicatella sp. s8]|uniref:YeiH family protein n=1 Tax=Granulicatella seriolae TaxID=2967226 RepID=A0ABT1WLM8_9LACT|nr:YeiH family protein [Granulicatella seriolae]